MYILIIKRFILSLVFLFLCVRLVGQEILDLSYKKHESVFGVGLFKSWLMDEYVDFDVINSQINPVFDDKYKLGFSFHTRYMYKPIKQLGVGIHLGLGLDVNSFIGAPLVLFGGSISFGDRHQFIIDIGWADGKRRKVPQYLRDGLISMPLQDVPNLVERTELNTGFYLGLGYRLW